VINGPHGATGTGTQSDFNTERDILYKLFFDLKKDMNDLKQMVFDVAHHQGYTPVDPASGVLMPVYNNDVEQHSNIPNYNNSTPILLESNDHHEDVEETLLLADREKEFIAKALKKHKSRRRDAAAELGISERTLYRKIKEYDIKE
jgi:DNA-binding NtrC family response regulator